MRHRIDSFLFTPTIPKYGVSGRVRVTKIEKVERAAWICLIKVIIPLEFKILCLKCQGSLLWIWHWRGCIWWLKSQESIFHGAWLYSENIMVIHFSDFDVQREILDWLADMVILWAPPLIWQKYFWGSLRHRHTEGKLFSFTVSPLKKGETVWED